MSQNANGRWNNATIFVALVGMFAVYVLFAGVPRPLADFLANALSSHRELSVRPNEKHIAAFPSPEQKITVEAAYRTRANSASDEDAAGQSSSQDGVQLFLVGIIRIQNGHDRALIRSVRDGKGTWLSVGDELQGWQLREINRESAIFETNGRRVELQVYSAPSLQRF